jgi:hypothetical protein
MVSVDSRHSASALPRPGLDVHEAASHLALSHYGAPRRRHGIKHYSHYSCRLPVIAYRALFWPHRDGFVRQR